MNTNSTYAYNISVCV